MDDERLDRRSHRRSMTAVLGCTAVIAVGGSLLIAAPAQAGTFSGPLSTVTTPVVTPVTTAIAPVTTAAAPVVTPVTTTAAPVVTPVVSTGTGTGGTVSTPVVTTVASTATPVVSTVTSTTAPAVAPIVAPVAPAVSTVTGTSAPIIGTASPVAAPAITTAAPVVTSVVTSATGTTTPTTGLAGSTAGAVIAPVAAATTTTAPVLGALAGGSTTSIVDLSGTGAGILDPGSANGLVGVGAGPGGLSVGLLGITAGVSIGGQGGTTTAGVAVSTPVGDPLAPSTTTPGQPGAPSTPAGTATSSTTPTAGSSITVAPSGAGATSFAGLQVTRTSATVYPVKDGYLDSVGFGIRAVTEQGLPVGVVGTAVLTRGGRVVKTWRVGGSSADLRWDGRIGGRVRAGICTLTVSASATDGTTRTASTTVRVLLQHLVVRSVSARTRVGGSASTAAMPSAVARALALGPVTLRLRSVAAMRGTTTLSVTGTATGRPMVLRSGTRTTAAIAITRSAHRVTIRTAGKRATRPASLVAIWTYRVLVP